MNRHTRRNMARLQRQSSRQTDKKFPKVNLRLFEKQEAITAVQEVYLKYRQTKLQKDSKAYKRIEGILAKPRMKSLREIHRSLFIVKENTNEPTKNQENKS